MRSSSCLIEFANGDGDSIRCGKLAVADCADCGMSICSGCRTECCGDSFCHFCYDYHVAHSSLHLRPRASRATQTNRNAA
jgi:hypothetical protein